MDSIIHVQGDPDSSLEPLILIHAISGFALPYLALGTLFDNDRPVYGISSPLLSTTGGNSEGTIPKSIRDLARLYTRLVQRELQPRGPYLLGGWSFGGVLAAEMANILLDEGEEVMHVFMIDSTNPGTYPMFEDYLEHKKIIALTYNAMAERIGGTAVDLSEESDDLRTPASRQSSTGSDSSDWRLRDEYDSGRSLVSRSSSQSDSSSDAEEDDLSNRSVLKDIRSHIGYGLLLMSTAPPIKIPSGAALDERQRTRLCTLIRCSKRPPPSFEVREHRRDWMLQVQQDKFLGWKGQDSNGPEVVPLPGPSHDEVFDATHSDRLTRVLATRLRGLGI